MKITIAGGSGFLGQNLKAHLVRQKHHVLVLTRNPKCQEDIFWNGKETGSWCDEMEGTDIIINLSGKSVDCRYTPNNKRTIFNSRTEPTLALHQYILQANLKPKLWLNASSATTYVHAETVLMTEDTGIIGDDFSMNVCKQWESSFFEQSYDETRQVALRTSIVFGNSGGAYPKLKTVTRFGLGGKQGNGNQMVSWIHLTDFCRAIDFIIADNSLTGPVNITSPYPITNKDLMKHMRLKYKLPIGLSQPVALLEIGALLIGTETELLLKSRNVYPKRLLDAGFKFEYPHIQDALLNLD